MFTTNCDAVSTKSWVCASAGLPHRVACHRQNPTTPPRRPARRPPRQRHQGDHATGAVGGAARAGGLGQPDIERSSVGRPERRSTGVPRRGRGGQPHRWPDRPPATHDAFPPASAIPLIYACLGATSDQPSFPRAPVCQFHPRTRQFPRLGRRTSRSGRRRPGRSRQRLGRQRRSAAACAGGWPGSGNGSPAGRRRRRPPVRRQHLIGRRVERERRRQRARLVRRHRQRVRPVRRRAGSRGQRPAATAPPVAPGSGVHLRWDERELVLRQDHPRIVDRLAAVGNRRTAPRIAAERHVALRVPAQLDGARPLAGELLARIVAGAAHHGGVVLRGLAVQVGRNVAQRGVGRRPDLRGPE